MTFLAKKTHQHKISPMKFHLWVKLSEPPLYSYHHKGKVKEAVLILVSIISKYHIYTNIVEKIIIANAYGTNNNSNLISAKKVFHIE